MIKSKSNEDINVPTKHAIDSKDDPLFQPIDVGNFHLSHRVVLTPLTRRRAINHMPQKLMQEYYTQRATHGGLLITEATGVTSGGLGDPFAPGIWSDEQRDAWKQIVTSVRQKTPDAVLLMQLWHHGRACHSDYLPNNHLPVAPSPIASNYGLVANSKGDMVPYETPQELSIDQINTIINEFRQACVNAKDAGFDGVEIHAANGYLINQFLENNSNHRTDEYGGSLENRVRFCKQVVSAAISVFGSGRVGVRFSPYGHFNDMHDTDPGPLYTEAIRMVGRLGLSYIHLIEPRMEGVKDVTNATAGPPLTLEPFVDLARSMNIKVIRAGGYRADTARTVVSTGRSDLIGFGRCFISNPDLPARIKHNWPCNEYNRDTFYTHDAQGYIDYPTYKPTS